MLVLPLCGCSIGGGDASAKKPRRPYAVLVVFDEFPGDTLLAPERPHRCRPLPQLRRTGRRLDLVPQRGHVVRLHHQGRAADPGRDPAAQGHVADRARPSALDLHRPREARLPDRHGGGGHGAVPAPILPRPSARRGPRSSRTSRAGGPSASSASSARSARAGGPTFWMKHALLPHGPWVYMPSGHHSRPEGPELLPGMQTVPGFYDDYLTRHNEQRYLLQLGFVDRLLGRLVARLKSQGMYDDTLIVVTADHGFAWQVGVPTRRTINLSNVGELAPVPLFVKKPRQKRGRVSDVLARTLDVTPTIADALGVRLGYRSRRPLRVLARRPRPPRGEPHQARLQLDRAHLPGALEGAPPRDRAPAPAQPRLGRLGEPLHEPGAEPRPRRAGGSPPRAARAARSATISLSQLVRARAALQRDRARVRSRAGYTAPERRESATSRSP